jgi:hypothetical protein
VSAKIPAVSIRFDWSESPYIEDGLTVSTFAEADQVVCMAARHMNPSRGGYDKTSFIITYADGETYEGRIDITPQDAHKDAPLTEHVRYFVECSAGLRKPAHYTVEEWEQWRASEWHKQREPQWREFHNKYAIGDMTGPEHDDAIDKVKQSAKVVNLMAYKAESRFGKLTPEQYLKLCMLRKMVDHETVAMGLKNGLTVDQLFTILAESLYSVAKEV